MSENKYVELTDQLVAKAEQLQEMQVEMHELSKAKDQEASTVEKLKVSESLNENTDVTLSIDFDTAHEDIITIAVDDREVYLSIEDFNAINQFLGRYNEVIFRFHNHLEAAKQEETTEAE